MTVLSQIIKFYVFLLVVCQCVVKLFLVIKSALLMVLLLFCHVIFLTRVVFFPLSLSQ